MQKIGQTRGSRGADHYLQSPDTFIRAPLPGMKRATAIVHAAPASGARFTQYTAEMEESGGLGPAGGQRFIYVLEGSVAIECDSPCELIAGGYAYIPGATPHTVSALSNSRVAVIEKPYERIAEAAEPEFLVGREDAVTPQPVLGDAALQVRTLLPDKPEYDFAMNTLTFDPGASLSLVEMHIMEHGLLMLEGGGIYRLGDCWYPVTGGDFIYMAPFCPQWFGALGKTPTRYLLYKDWNRHPGRAE